VRLCPAALAHVLRAGSQGSAGGRAKGVLDTTHAARLVWWRFGRLVRVRVGIDRGMSAERQFICELPGAGGLASFRAGSLSPAWLSLGRWL